MLANQMAMSGVPLPEVDTSDLKRVWMVIVKLGRAHVLAGVR